MRRAGYRACLAIHPAQIDGDQRGLLASAEELAAAQEMSICSPQTRVRARSVTRAHVGSADLAGRRRCWRSRRAMTVRLMRTGLDLGAFLHPGDTSYGPGLRATHDAG